MPITKSEDGYIELSNTARLAVSQGNNSGLNEKIEPFLGRSVRIPQESIEAYIEGKVVNDFVPQNVLSGDPEAQPCSSSEAIAVNPELNKAVPPPPVNLDRADLMARNHRHRVGGKGQFLSVMAGAGLPVPPFQVIEHSALQAIDDVVIEPELLAPFHPDGIDARQLQPVTLGSLKEDIPAMDRINQANWLNALGKLLISDDFLPQVANQPIARNIRTLHQQLQADGSNQPVIIRSSGLTEDGFGDTRAGQYKSCLHSGGDILKTCLTVLASGYQPALCPNGRPQPMALIMQSYLDCRFGGVALSHTSLQDNTLQIEYAPGQPRAAVAGTYSINPHRYQIKRNGDNPIQWRRGEISSYFTLKETAGGFTEEKHEGSSAEELPEGIPGQLKRYIVQLENLLGCPVDVEFAVDQKDRLYLVQVRPVTALPGAASFSGNPPNQPLCAGELVSDGLASGEAYYVDKPLDDPSSIPEGAIIHAINADHWMLDPVMINRASGYVFKNGGNNDHIAIMLKQSGKPCMRSDAPFIGEKPKPSSTVTLIAGRFDQTTAACLLDGDQVAHWSNRYTKPTLDYATILTTIVVNKPSAPTFSRVEQGFIWLNAQNQRVLNYFLRGRLLDLCLASGRNKLLSMSPHRAEVLQALRVEVESFLQDTQDLVEGYEHFLQLHISGQKRAEKNKVDLFEGDFERLSQYFKQFDQVRCLLKVIQPLKDRLTAIKSQVQNLINKITDPIITHQELPKQPINYEQWLNDGERLINELQQLNQPDTVDDIRSAHDLVFYIHKQFIAALEPVASLSDQGVVEKAGNVTISSFFTDKPQSLLTTPIKEALDKAGETKVLDLPAACIANIELGVHACTLAMFEHGEGGKGRKLHLVLSDNFDSEHKQGKLKRFWFLVHAIQLRLAGKRARNMTTCLNPATGALTVELRHMESTAAMKAGFLSLTNLLLMIKNLDMRIDETNITGHPDMWRWDFPAVEKMIRQSQDDPNKNDHVFKYCLFKQGYSQWFDISAPHIESECSQEHLVFFTAGRTFAGHSMSQKWYSRKNQQRIVNEIDQWLTEITAHLQSEAERVKKELVFMLLISYPAFFHSIHMLIQQKYFDDLNDRDLLKKLCCHCLTLFANLPLKLRNNKTFALDVVISHKDAFQYAGEQVKNDKYTVIAMLQRFPLKLREVSSAMQEDSDVVLAAVNANGLALRFAGELLKSNHSIVAAAVKQSPIALTYASIALKQNKNFILTLVRQTPEVLEHLEPEYQDREITLAALKGIINMYECVRHDTVNEPSFLQLTAE